MPNNAIKWIGIRRLLMGAAQVRVPGVRGAESEKKDKWDDRDPLDSWEEEEMLHPLLM